LTSPQLFAKAADALFKSSFNSEISNFAKGSPNSDRLHVTRSLGVHHDFLIRLNSAHSEISLVEFFRLALATGTVFAAAWSGTAAVVSTSFPFKISAHKLTMMKMVRKPPRKVPP
jgi:hypothetical protein